MAKLKLTEEQAKQLVNNGHLTHATFNKIKASGGFMQGLDEGGVVTPDASGVSEGSDAAVGSPQFVPPPVQAPAQVVVPTAQDTAASGVSAGTGDGVSAGQPPAPAPQSPAVREAGHVSPENVVGGNAPQIGNPPMPGGADYVNQVNKGMSDQLEGTKKAAQAQANSASEGAKFMSGMADQMKREDAMEKIHEFDRQDAAQQGIEKLNKMGSELMSQKIDPDHFWATRSTGQKVAAAIGIALGGLGQGLLKSNHNAAMDIINQAIDRDIDAQKANLSNKRAGLETQASLYGISQKNFQDERQARLAARTLGLQAAEMQLRGIASKNQAPEIQAQAQALLGKLQVEQAAAKQQLAFTGYRNKLLQQVSGGGGAGVAGMNPEMVRVALGNEYGDRFVPGVGFSKDKERASKVLDFKASDDAFQKDLQGLKDFAEKNRGTTMDRATVNEGKAKAAALQNSYRKAESMGVYKESESNFMKNLIGDDPTTWYNYVPQLNALGDSAKNARESFYGANIEGYKPIQEGPARGR